MAMLNFVNLPDYQNRLLALLKLFEAPHAAAKDVGDGAITIGLGFNLNAKVKVRIAVINRIMGNPSGIGTAAQIQLEAAYRIELLNAIVDKIDPTTGQVLTGQQKIDKLNEIMGRRATKVELNGYVDQRQSTFSLPTTGMNIDAVVADMFRTTVKDLYEADLKMNFPALMQQGQPSAYLLNFETSREHAVLFSLVYNGGPGLIGKKLKAAIEGDNRAEAWFEIRYGSNAKWGTPTAEGLAKRRFLESQIFGLYGNSSDVTLTEAKQTFEMLTKHRDEIVLYEARFGIPTDGSASQRNMIELASSDPAFIAFGIPIQSLYDALKPARDAFIGWLNTVIPASEPKILAAAINPAAIYYLAEGEKHVIDARGDDTGGNGIEKNIIVGNSASNMLFGGIGDDTLVGMDGDDVIFGGGGANTLYGGIGNDTYMIDLRDGIQSHRIIDTDGSNKIIVIDANGVAYNTIVLQQVSGQNIWIDSKGFVTAKHNSPWQIDLPDGSTIQLSDSALMSNAELSAAFGITLLDTPAASVNTFTGDFIKALEANQLNYKTSANGYVSAGVLPSAADLIVGTIANDVILGLGGNDALAGGDGADSIDGGDGADAIQGGRGADTLLGGAGDDFIFGSGDGALSRPLVRNFTPRASSGVEIARGFDWVVYNPLGVDENGFDGWTIEGIGDPGPNGELESNYIDGGAGNDEIFSGSANDVSYGGLGDDTLRGMAGSDALYGDDGNDNIEGDGTPLAGYLDATADAQNGNDALNGGAGNDILRGQGGDDELFGGIGADTLLGDAHDTTITIHGSDYLDGGDGADSMEGGGRDDVLFGGTGNDTLFGDAEDAVVAPAYQGNDLLDGGDGDDYMTGEGGADTLLGGLGADILKGDDVTLLIAASGHGRDLLEGGEGNDSIYGGGGDDTLIGGGGADQLIGEDLGGGGSAGSSIALASHGADLVDGGDGNDTMMGQGGADTLLGGTGQDQIQGGDGDDLLEGGADLDILEGGTGNDYYVVNAGDAPLVNGFAESIFDASGMDTVELNGFVTATTQLLAAAPGSSTLLVGDGIDQWLVVYDGLAGGIENYIMDGLTYSYAGLVGSFSNVQINAVNATGSNVLLGGRADESIQAANAFSYISGGFGDDALLAAKGGNTYYYNLGDGVDVITDGGGSVVAGVAQPTSRMVFGADVSLADVSLDFSAGQLIIYAQRADVGFDAIRLNGFNAANAAAALSINAFEFADATVLSAAGLVGLGFDRRGSTSSDIEPGSSGSDRYDVSLGNDTLAGGSGSDTYRYGFGAGLDVVDDGNASLTDSDSLMLTTDVAVADVRLVRSGNDLLVKLGAGESDILLVRNHFAASGIEKLVFADGTTWLANSFAAHTFVELTDAANTSLGSAAADLVDGRGGNDTLSGQAGDDFLFGGSGVDVLNGDAGNDTLVGGLAGDVMAGGVGSDTYTVDDITDVVNETNSTSAGGTDLVLSRLAAYTLAANVENGRVMLAGAASLTGNSLVNVIFAGNGDNVLDGGAGADTASYIYAAGPVTLSLELADAQATGASGNDQLLAIENLAGSAYADMLVGNASANTLTGNAGADTMVGGDGNDTYDVDDAGDFVEELDTLTSGSADLVLSRLAAYVMADGVEYGRILSTGVASLTGNVLANVLFANAGNNVIDGGEGIDAVSYTYASAAVSVSLALAGAQATGGSGADLLISIENISGTAFNDALIGNDAANVLNGLAGIDTLAGGLGNDVYNVDDVGDVVAELAGGGVDTVYSSIDYTLPAQVENLRILAAGSATGIGNGLGNVIYSGAGNNVMDGAAGTDTVSYHYAGAGVVVSLGLTAAQVTGGAGTDTLRNFEYLVGSTFNDVLSGDGNANVINGNAGADNMAGGAGNDSYYVDNVGDVVVELAAAGTDTVTSSTSYTLGANLENLALQGTVAISGTGNSLHNLLTGNSAANTLSGLTGNDTLDGGAGNDTLVGAAGADTYLFGAGRASDTIQDNDATAGVKDLVLLQGALSQSDVRFSQVVNNLEMLIAATGEKLVVQDWYLGSQYHVEEFRFSDGSLLTDTQAQGLVGALAIFGGAQAAINSSVRLSPHPQHFM